MATSIRNVQGFALSRLTGNTGMRNVQAMALVDPNNGAGKPFGDTDYRKPQLTLIRDLIEKANPGYKAMVPESAVSYGAPKPLATAGGSDTGIRVTANSGQRIVIGNTTITYRRIDLTKLFAGRTLILTKYTISNTLPYADILALILSQLGVNLDPADFTARTISENGTSLFTVLGTSLCYKGSFTVQWVKGKRDLAEMMGNKVLDGRVWPQGLVDVQDGSKYQGEHICYDADFSFMASTLNAYTSGQVDTGAWNTPLDSSAMVAGLKTVRPDIPWSRSAAPAVGGGNIGGIGYLYFKRYILPNPAVPEANSGMYTKVMVLEPTNMNTPENNWFFGRILIHYN